MITINPICNMKNVDIKYAASYVPCEICAIGIHCNQKNLIVYDVFI